MNRTLLRGLGLLLAAAPELGQYFAIGQQVVVVYNGVAYQVVEGDGNSTVTIPNSCAA